MFIKQYHKAPQECSTLCAHQLAEECLGRISLDPNDCQGARRLQVAAILCHTAQLRGLRLGPVESSPGEWHYFLAAPISGLLLRPGDRIVSFSGRAVSEAGLPIGFPPLHMHHIHVITMSNRDGGHPNNHYWETHGDFSVGDSFGVGAASTEGYTRRLPPGHAMYVGDYKVASSAVLNDVRARDAAGGASAAPLRFYLEISFELGAAALRPAHSLWFDAPLSAVIPQDVYGRYAVPSGHAVSWWFAAMPVDGSMLIGAWLHTHRARYRAYLLLRGKREPQGCAEWGISAIADRRWGDVRQVAEPIKLLDTLRTSYADDLICEGDERGQNWVELRPDDLAKRGEASGVRPGRYDRAGAIKCRPWSFRQGDEVTHYALHEPVWDASIETFAMHTNLFFFASPAEGQATTAGGEAISVNSAISSSSHMNPGCES